MPSFPVGGFPPGSNFLGPDRPYLGPLRCPESGEYITAPAHALENEWAETNGDEDARGSCGGSGGQPRPKRVSLDTSQNTDPGDAGHAVYRAAKMPNIARSRAAPAVLAAQSCGLPGGPCRVNLASGNLLAHTRPPAAGEIDPVPILTYNSRSTDDSEFGFGWTGTYKRSVYPDDLDPNAAHVLTGTGSDLRYSNKDANGLYTPPAGAKNALVQNPDGTWTETQPDGFQVNYDSTGLLSRLESNVGGRWTMAYDGLGKVTGIVDPLGGRTTLAYDVSAKIRRIQDSGGRITSFTVDANGDLTRRTSPELCVTEFRYDTSHRPIALIDPDGNRTSYSYDTTRRVTAVLSPLNQRTTYAYLTGNRTVVTNADNERTTLTFGADETLQSVVDVAGNRTTYVWDAKRVKVVQDPLGNRFTFSYVTLGDNTKRLQAIATPLGGRFTYSYGSPPQYVEDEGGHRTTLLWDANGNKKAEIDPNLMRTSFTWDGQGNLKTVKNPLGHVTTSVWSGGLKVAQVNPLGQRTSYAFDTNKNLKRVQDATGNITSYTWNGTNQLKVVTDPLGKRTSYTYTGHGELRTVTNPLGERVTQTYNDDHLLKTVATPSCVPYRIFASFSCLSGRVIDLLENLSKPWVTRAR